MFCEPWPEVLNKRILLSSISRSAGENLNAANHSYILFLNKTQDPRTTQSTSFISSENLLKCEPYSSKEKLYSGKFKIIFVVPTINYHCYSLTFQLKDVDLLFLSVNTY